MSALREIATHWRQSGDTRRLAAELSVLLRRLCLSRLPREQVAGLTGHAWLRKLDSQLPGDHFQNGIGRVLVEAPYASHAELDGEALLQLCERWVSHVARRTGARP